MRRIDLLAGVLLAGGVLTPTTVEACVCTPSFGIPRGFLTFASLDEISFVPRNVAVVGATLTRAEDRSEIALEELDVENLRRPVTPLPAGTEVVATFTSLGVERTQTAITTDDIDTEPPSRPVLASATLCTDSCCCHDVVEVALLATDDQTPDEELVYLIYYGATPEEAMSGSQLWDMGRDPPFSVGQGDPWIATSVVDLAGNESARSEPVMSNASTGCAAVAATGASTTTFLLLFFVWIAYRTGRHSSWAAILS